MVWFLLVGGLILILLGVWGGPRRKHRPEKSSRIPKDATVQEAWDILTSPVQYEDELIKIPEHKPFRLPSSDRRFYQGLAVGLGMGLVMAAFLSPFLPGQAETPSQVAAEQGEKPETPAADPDPAGAQKPDEQAKPAETETPPAVTPPEPPKPANVTVTIEPGSSSHDIASTLKAAGVIADEQEFLRLVEAYGVETSLKAGTFVIPTDATVDQVIEQVTK